MTVSVEQILKAFPELITFHTGPKENTAKHACTVASPSEQALAFVSHVPDEIPYSHIQSISILVVPNNAIDRIDSSQLPNTAILATETPRLAMAMINSKFLKDKINKMSFTQDSIHPTAVLGKNIKFGERTLISPHAVIGDNVTFGKDCFIGAGSVIESNAQIGNNVHLHPQVFIGHSCILEDDVEIHPQSSIGTEGYGYATDADGIHHRIPHYGRAILKKGVHLGSGVNVDRGTFNDTVIESGTKVDNHCHIGHNGKIGKNCLITAGFISAGSANIGNQCTFGGRTSIGGHIKITDNVLIGPHSAAVGNIEKPGSYAGFPTMPMSEWKRAQATYAGLPKMRKLLNKVVKKLGLND